MDVDRVTYQTEAVDADQQKKIAFTRQVGSAGSAFEHAVPERLFADPSKPLNDPSQPQGISAVKALAIAAAQGQKIYTLDDKNTAYHQAIVASLGTDADTKAEITNALYAGKEVTVHQADINANGWTGMGYIILDPDTGAGAYKISGGANGGSLIDQIHDQLALLGGWLSENLANVLAALSAVLEHTGGVAGFMGALAGAIAAVSDFANIVQNCSGAELFEGLRVFLGGMVVSAGLIGFYGAFFIIPAIIMILYSSLMGLLMGAVLNFYVNKTCKE
jgi:hypothetical protein